MLLALDLDGTLLLKEGKLAPSEMSLLTELRNRGHFCALLTGRNLYSLGGVIPENGPLDFVAYSTGACLLDWQTGESLYQENMEVLQSRELAEFLKEQGHSFFALDALPDNHFNYPVPGENPPEDFFRRQNRYKPFHLKGMPPRVSQFLLVCRDETHRENTMHSLERFSPPIQQVKTTSPMDRKTPWLELFPQGVHKGRALSFLQNHLKIGIQETLAMGNDWNDFEMLNQAGRAYLVPDSPRELKENFPVLGVMGESSLASLIHREKILE